MTDFPQKTTDEIVEDFELFDDWEERYRFIIELGNSMPPFPDEHRIAENLVQGCQSQVWLVMGADDEGNEKRVLFQADSDSQIVKGLIAILVSLCNGRTPEEILTLDLDALFEQLDLRSHLSNSRSNGLNSMVKKIRELAVSIAG